MSSQSDRKPGVPALDGQKERILGQRHDLNKCTLHDSPRTWTLTRIGRCVKGLAIFADALREPLLAVTAVFGPAPWAGAPSTHIWPARRSFSARFRWPYARMTLKSTETLITPATCPFTDRSLYKPRTAAGARICPRPPSRPVPKSQVLKSWVTSLAADPKSNQSDRKPGVLVHDGRRSESQVSGMI